MRACELSRASGGAVLDASRSRRTRPSWQRPSPWQGETIVRAADPAGGRAAAPRLRRAACSREDLRLRFFSARRELPRSELARLTQIDYAREMAFIAVRPSPTARLQTLGVVRAVADPDNVEAEFAIIVRSDLKGQGLGHSLLAQDDRLSARRGTQRMVAYVLRENEGMRELARSQGFALNAAASDADALYFVLVLPGLADRRPALAVY